jgi:hypothetical protein
VSSRLLEYELWVRINARGLAQTHGDATREGLGTVALMEMAPLVLVRALEPFPAPVRTLDALHLASMLFLREHGEGVVLATYDDRLVAAARGLGFALVA